MKPKVLVYPAAEWAASVGRRLATRLGETPDIRLCLPTGNTPAPAYRAFVDAGGQLDRAEVFLLDEFVLPAGHPARCDAMLSRTLLDHLPATPRTLHHLDVDVADFGAECARYEALLSEQPLDLTLLGLGGNGHLGLNEPGATQDSLTRVVDLQPETIRQAADYGPGPAPRRGVTLGMRAILESRKIWLLVTGAHKAGILGQALEGPVGPAIPASYLQAHPDVTLLADVPAAALLR